MDNSTHMGQIEFFVTSPPSVLVRELIPLPSSLLKEAGHPCRSSLIFHQRT